MSEPPAKLTPADLFSKPLPVPVRSRLTQTFAKLAVDPYTLIGYSVAGEETVIQIPELDVCFDVGRAPNFMLSSNLLCLSHAHMDHLAGVAYYLSQRVFQGMPGGTILLHDDLVDPVDELLGKWRKLERQEVPYELIGMLPGDRHKVRKDFHIEAVRTHHGRTSLGFNLIDVRHKLRPELRDLPGEKIAELRRDGQEVHYAVEAPLVSFLGDTAFGDVFKHDNVRRARILLTECTFYENETKRKAKAGKHLHVDQLVDLLPALENELIVIGHVSRRIGVKRAKSILRKKVSDEQWSRLHFLMDHSGDAEDQDDE